MAICRYRKHDLNITFPSGKSELLQQPPDGQFSIPQSTAQLINYFGPVSIV